MCLACTASTLRNTAYLWRSFSVSKPLFPIRYLSSVKLRIPQLPEYPRSTSTLPLRRRGCPGSGPSSTLSLGCFGYLTICLIRKASVYLNCYSSSLSACQLLSHVPSVGVHHIYSPKLLQGVQASSCLLRQSDLARSCTGAMFLFFFFPFLLSGFPCRQTLDVQTSKPLPSGA